MYPNQKTQHLKESHREQAHSYKGVAQAVLDPGGALLLHGWRTDGLAGALEIVAGAYGVWRGARSMCTCSRS